MSGLSYIDAATVLQLLTPQAAVEAITGALLAGVDPAGGPPRSAVPTTAGEYLIMPAEAGPVTGVKVLTVAPDNPSHGRARIQGVYALFDAQYLHPIALMDAVSITNLRTPAVSISAILPLVKSLAGKVVNVVAFGTGPQGQGHVRTLLPFVGSIRVTYVSRGKPGDLDDFPGTQVSWLAASSAELPQRIAQADVVFAATSAATPLFDSALIAPGTIVVAVGSHDRGHRELDSALLARSQVVVEDLATAVREAGDVVLALAEDAIREADLITLAGVATGKAELDASKVTVFKSTGMAWEDLVVADAVYQRWLAGR